jgi:hypothetical protein
VQNNALELFFEGHTIYSLKLYHSNHDGQSAHNSGFLLGADIAVSLHTELFQ